MEQLIIQREQEKRQAFEKSMIYGMRVHSVRPSELRLRNSGVIGEAVAQKTVALIGLGALGSAVAELLANAGVGRFRLCDSDRLAGFLDPADLTIVTTADESVESVINEIAVLHRKTMLYGRALRRGSIGRVFLVRPGRDACKACLAEYTRAGRRGGAVLAVLSTVSLSSGLGTLLTEVAQLLRPQPAPIQDSPAAIMQWYHPCDEAAEGQAAAQEQYDDQYVEWELTIEQLEPAGAYAQTISKEPGSPPDGPPYAFWAFFTNQADILPLREDQQVVVHGKIVLMNAGNIFLRECQRLSSSEG